MLLTMGKSLYVGQYLFPATIIFIVILFGYATRHAPISKRQTDATYILAFWHLSESIARSFFPVVIAACIDDEKKKQARNCCL